jgi:prolyl 4-hydroxylase
MKRIALEPARISPTFIGSWMLDRPALCDELIVYFEKHVGKQSAGITGAGLDLSVKDRVDIPIAPNELHLPGNEPLEAYIDGLHKCYADYLVQWPFLKNMGTNLEISTFNLGRYREGQHFQRVHTERSGLSTLHRVLAWMTYLNDVEDGGETYFSHYDVEIKPKRGLTLIWPAEWTHAHKGNVLRKNSKYMITGWLHFPS